MSDADTSAEAVERLAQIWERSSWAGGGFTHTRAAATLRALLAERDAAMERLNVIGHVVKAARVDVRSASLPLPEDAAP